MSKGWNLFQQNFSLLSLQCEKGWLYFHLQFRKMSCWVLTWFICCDNLIDIFLWFVILDKLDKYFHYILQATQISPLSFVFSLNNKNKTTKELFNSIMINLTKLSWWNILWHPFYICNHQIITSLIATSLSMFCLWNLKQGSTKKCIPIYIVQSLLIPFFFFSFLRVLELVQP